jgi:hypothetical protein
MFFYVDESGHTGLRLFDEDQPILYYGVLSAQVNLDLLIEGRLRKLRLKLKVERLHAGELGNGRLVEIADELIAIQKQFRLRFDFYRVMKPDHAVISFFDQVFDSAMNRAVAWNHYWTPMRYVALLKLASLFDDAARKAAWAARIDTNKPRAQANLAEVCRMLHGRIGVLKDESSRRMIGEALEWAANHPAEISYNVDDRDQIKQISPNIIGFQFVMHGIANRLKLNSRQASRIVVDRQTEFNKAQKTLADFFAAASGVQSVSGPGMPIFTFVNMPKTPVEFVAGTESAGLELVDIYLWIFKRAFEGRDLADELIPLFNSQLNKGRTDEISLDALDKRWRKYFEDLPQLEELSPDQLSKAREIMVLQEKRRQEAMNMPPNNT